MKKLLLSLGIIGIFGIGATTNNLNLFDSHKTVEDNISENNNKKITSSEKEKISQETNLENSCCTKILNK
tara:strand:- start:879 stop:1088 length:210 start_codon:yes stop_codon:yes gene_type:complete